jgi:hypothetical protein
MVLGWLMIYDYVDKGMVEMCTENHLKTCWEIISTVR